MRGVITDVNFMPMVEGRPSILRCVIEVDGPEGFVTIDAEDSIKNLSKAFDFDIISDNEWDLSRLKGRRIIFEERGKGYRFKSFEN